MFEKVRQNLSGSELSIAWSYLKHDKLSFGALGFVVALILVAIFANIVSPYDPLAQTLDRRLEAPSLEHPFGLDEFGRDILSRLIHGSRISLAVGFVVILIALVSGSIIGSIAGYFRGKVDMVLMRIADIFLSFPGLILAIGIMAVLGQSIFNVMAALSLVSWPGYARVIRGQVLNIRQLEYVEAAKVMGSPSSTIIVSHILPNSFAPIIVLATIGTGWAILAEAGLSFLGLGVGPPNPSWGSMVASGRMYITLAPHISAFSGVMIAATVMAFNLLGDGLRDALDPKMRI